MKHPRIQILGYSEAGMLLSKRPPDVDVQGILAIHGQREYPIDTVDVSHSLVLTFDDTDNPDVADPIEAARIRLRQQQQIAFGLTLQPPTADHAISIIEFARSVRDVNGVMLFQCQAGVSRSPAAALLSLATWTGPGHKAYCVDHVRAVRPCAMPHRDLVRFGDDLLGRDGQLVAALDSTLAG